MCRPTAFVRRSISRSAGPVRVPTSIGLHRQQRRRPDSTRSKRQAGHRALVGTVAWPGAGGEPELSRALISGGQRSTDSPTGRTSEARESSRGQGYRWLATAPLADELVQNPHSRRTTTERYRLPVKQPALTLAWHRTDYTTRTCGSASVRTLISLSRCAVPLLRDSEFLVPAKARAIPPSPSATKSRMVPPSPSRTKYTCTAH